MDRCHLLHLHIIHYFMYRIPFVCYAPNYLISLFIFVSYVFRHLVLVCCLSVEKKTEKNNKRNKTLLQRVQPLPVLVCCLSVEKKKEKRKQTKRKHSYNVYNPCMCYYILRPASRETWICSLSQTHPTLFLFILFYFKAYLSVSLSLSRLRLVLYTFLHFNGNNNMFYVSPQKKLTPHSFCSSYFILRLIYITVTSCLLHFSTLQQ